MDYSQAKQIMAGYSAVRSNEINAINAIIAKCDDTLNQIKLETDVIRVETKKQIDAVIAEKEILKSQINALIPIDEKITL